MAGAGYKLFNTGDVLTAQQVNEYLMQQTVMVFADASARTTALSGVLAEGMLSYLKSDDKTYAYNGTSWVEVGGSSPLTTKGDLYTYSTADTRLASSGVNGDVLTVDTSTATGLKWATPASGTISWTQRLTAALGNQINGIEYNGSNLFVAVGDAGSMATSPDGITWTSRTSGFGANAIYKVFFGNGLWVAVGANGTLTTSTDGITWTARTANMSTNQITDVTYANSLWVAVGDGGGTTNTGGITYSTDGLTWTRKSQSLTVGTSYYTVVWNGTNWIVGANSSTNNYLYASSPSGTWTAGASSSAATISRLYWDGTRHTEVTNAGSLRFSTSTTLGTTTNLTGGLVRSAFFANYYYNGKIFAAASPFYSISTTPGTGNYVGAREIVSAALPSVSMLNTGLINTNDTSTIWAGSLGYLIADATGRIWSSF